MDTEMYRLFFEVQQRHWWFVARRKIVLDLIARHYRPGPDSKVLDIGCGAGLMLNELTRFGETSGMDSAEEAIAFSREVFEGDVRAGQLPGQVPFPGNSFNLITALDVIEHIDDDVGSLQAMRALLRPGAKAVITVPAFMFLWTEFDEINAHKRRYTRSELCAKLRQAGFAVERISYFNTLLFPLVVLVRALNRLFKRSGADDLSLPNRFANAALTGLFGCEKWLLRYLSFPFGVSILAVASCAPEHPAAV
jgi:SAM-dependent methyltransferase